MKYLSSLFYLSNLGVAAFAILGIATGWVMASPAIKDTGIHGLTSEERDKIVKDTVEGMRTGKIKIPKVSGMETAETTKKLQGLLKLQLASMKPEMGHLPQTANHPSTQATTQASGYHYNSTYISGTSGSSGYGSSLRSNGKLTGIAREEYVLDGSGIPKEQWFPGRHPANAKYDTRVGAPPSPPSSSAKWSEFVINAKETLKEIQYPGKK